jgi:hypothetical protein
MKIAISENRSLRVRIRVVCSRARLNGEKRKREDCAGSLAETNLRGKASGSAFENFNRLYRTQLNLWRYRQPSMAGPFSIVSDGTT